MPRRKLAFAFAFTFLCLAAALLGTAASARAQTVLRGIEDLSLCHKGATNTPARVDFLATKLHAQMLRFDVDWDDLEEQRGEYDEIYLNELAATIRAAASDGLEVIVTLLGTPRWASDRTLWRYAPPGQTQGVYHSFYPPAAKHLDDLQAFATKLASTFAGDVTGYECRNEPNLWVRLYPQRIPSDAAFGARRYAAMLMAFSKGVRAGDPSALVLAGSTAPTGDNTRLSTSPLRFARLIKTMVKSSVFDAYSHHPYTVGGTSNIAPEGTPRDPARTISLGNISTLLRIFPNKPFYLTEYGYYTRYNAFFGFSVNQSTQARYLTRAYRYAARFPQIRALVWFPYHDDYWKKRIWGTWSGLITKSGAFKRSWFAFARGNRLTVTASKPFGASVRLSGRLTSASTGGLPDKTLVLSRRTAGGAWRVVRNVTTAANGSYHASVKVSGTAHFRVVWLGVVRSATLSVKGA